MDKVKYTLDTFEDGYYVFLEFPNEENQLLIPENEVIVEISEGDLVLITKLESVYQFEVLKEDTKDMKKIVSNLLDKLKNKM